MSDLSAYDFFRAPEIPDGAVLSGKELENAFWQLKKMQREAQQQQAYWKSVNDSLSEAYKKLAAFQEDLKASRAAVHKANEQLERANEQLEEKVRERTAELTDKLVKIEEQQQTIRALFTPVIQVWDKI